MRGCFVPLVVLPAKGKLHVRIRVFRSVLDPGAVAGLGVSEEVVGFRDLRSGAYIVLGFENARER